MERAQGSGKRKAGEDLQNHFAKYRRTPPQEDETPGPAKTAATDQSAGTKRGGAATEDLTGNAQEDFQQEKAKERQVANKFMLHLAILIDTWRTDKITKADMGFSRRMNAYTQKIRDIVKESDLRMNASLKFPFSGLMDLQSFLDSRERILEKEQEYHEANVKVEKAVAARAKVGLDAQQSRDKSAESTAETKRRANDADGELMRLNMERQIIEEELFIEFEEDEEKAELVFSFAENTLINMNMMQIPEEAVKENQKRNDEVQNSREGEASSYAAAQTYLQVTHETENPEQDPPQDITEIAREQALDGLQQAEDELKHIEYLRDRAQRHYSREARDFLNAKKRGELRGSKEDFDRLHFIGQAKFTAELKEAEMRVERAKEDARKVGAVTAEEATSEFGDVSDNENADEDGDPSNPLRELKYDGIRAWLDLESDRLFPDGGDAAVGEDEWSVADIRSVEPRAGEKEGLFMLPLDDDFGSDPDEVATGKERKLIDDWKQRKEQLRLIPDPESLQWWQAVTGV